MTGIEQLCFWQERLTKPEFVYFVRPKSGGPVKIGRAQNPEARLRALQTGCPWPLELLYVVPAGGKAERSLHRRFRAMRTMGEWFDGDELELLLVFADALSHHLIETYDGLGAPPVLPEPDDVLRSPEVLKEARDLIQRMWLNRHNTAAIVDALNGDYGVPPLGGHPWTAWDVGDQMDAMANLPQYDMTRPYHKTKGVRKRFRLSPHTRAA